MNSKIEKIIEITREHFSVSEEEFYSKKKYGMLAISRHVAWALIKEHLEYGYLRIGEIFGKDHTTILHGVKKVERYEHENYDLHMEYLHVAAKVGRVIGISDKQKAVENAFRTLKATSVNCTIEGKQPLSKSDRDRMVFQIMHSDKAVKHRPRRNGYSEDRMAVARVMVSKGVNYAN